MGEQLWNTSSWLLENIEGKEEIKLGKDCVNRLENKICQRGGSIGRAVGVWPWSQSL